MPDVSKCRSCRATILWARSEHGNLMPLDRDPVPDGNIAIIDGVAHVFNGTLFEEMLPEDTPRYKNHFATCPNAAKHRKKQTKETGQ